MTTQQYVYRIVKVVKVTDGDTYWFELDVGFRMTALVNIRLSGWDCPERTKGSLYERQQAKYATGYADAWLLTAKTLWVQTQPDPDDFGRWLGIIWTEAADGTPSYLGNYLAGLQLATPWPTRWREVYDQGQ